MSDQPLPQNRWETSPRRHLYAETFLRLMDEGADITGEARLADALVPRGARILDAGSGLGRIGAHLLAAGHHVTAVEKEADLVGLSRTRFPDLPVIETDLLALTPELLQRSGAPASYDLIVLVGNVMVLLAEDTEVRTLRLLGDLLADGGRILVGFHPVDGPSMAPDYPFEDFARHVGEAGLVVQHRFGGYELEPPSQRYVVAVLAQEWSSWQFQRVE